VGGAGVARLGLVPELAPVLLWGWLLVALTVIDLDFKLLPDALTLPGTVLAVIAALLGPGAQHALLGMVVGSGYLWLFAWIWRVFLKREGMGGGDIKLAAMFGALLGPVGAFLTISLAAFAGALAGGCSWRAAAVTCAASCRSAPVSRPRPWRCSSGATAWSRPISRWCIIRGGALEQFHWPR
jgi:prepilin signal peptidase PulO-like enzyme (type II secretory pathway)